MAAYLGTNLSTLVNRSTCPEVESPADFVGHGTHTASTAAGSFVQSASYLGVDFGSPRGTALEARLSIYKTSWCISGAIQTTSDVLAAMDSAVKDGADVISMSLGGDPIMSFSRSLTLNRLNIQFILLSFPLFWNHLERKFSVLKVLKITIWILALHSNCLISLFLLSFRF